MSASSSSPSSSTGHLFLGIDSSTQSFKITAIDSAKRILQQVAISFEHDMPDFHTQAGIIRNDYGFGQVPPPAEGAEHVGEVRRQLACAPSDVETTLVC